MRFDKRSNGYHGRALFSDYPAKNLVKGDRLEPSRELRDVHELDLVTNLPLKLTFWSTSKQTRLNRKTPLFTIPGLTCELTSFCSLHILELGLYGRWCSTMFWFILLCNVFDLETTDQETLCDAGMPFLRQMYFEFWREHRVVDPSENISEVHNLTIGMLGTKEKPRISQLRGGEVRSLVPFCNYLCKRFEHKLGRYNKERFQFLQAAGHEFEQSGWGLP